MRPDEEPELQLLQVSGAQLAEHVAAQKAAADKATGMGALGGFASAAAGGSNKSAAAAAASAAHTGGQSKQQQQQQPHPHGVSAPDSAMHARELSPLELHRLQVERDQLSGESVSSAEAGYACVTNYACHAELELALGSTMWCAHSAVGTVSVCKTCAGMAIFLRCLCCRCCVSAAVLL